MKARLIEVFLNVVFWLTSGWLVVNSLSVTGQEVLVENGVETVTFIRDEHLLNGLIVIVVLSALGFYLHLWNIFSHTKRKKAWITIVISAAILVLPALIMTLISAFGSRFSIMIPITFEYGIYLFYFSCAIGYGVVKLFLRSEQTKKSLLLEKKQTELSLLRNQLQPHFLFNALNNVLSMVDQKRDPRLATALAELSELLRYVVQETQESTVPIRKEIDFIKAYAQLHQLRFDDSEVVFSLDVEGEFTDQPIEPGILIPFVENAFKYGAIPEQTSEIEMKIDLRQEGAITFYCSNPIHDVLQTSPGAGTGLDNVRKRLQLTYPGMHSLNLSYDKAYIVELTIRTR